MVIDKISAKALESLLSITFGDQAVNYEVVSKQGLNYDGIEDIEFSFTPSKKKIYSPFSTLATRVLLEKDSTSQEKIKSVTEHAKRSGIIGFFYNLKNKNNDLLKLSEIADKCISDELIKSQRILDNKDLENPAVLLLLKGIKNLENPESIYGLRASSIQEVGAIQIGMAINNMKDNTPNLFSYNPYDQKNFNRALNELSKTKFIDRCCSNAHKQRFRILELSVAANKDTQFDAFISNGEINYSTSFKNLDRDTKDEKIYQIKKETSSRIRKNSHFK